MALPDHSTYRQATQNNLKWTQAYYCPELIIDRVHVVHIHTVALYKHLSTSKLFLKCLQGLRHHWSHSCENKEKYKSSGKMMSGLLCTWHMYSFNLQPDDQWKICIKETTEQLKQSIWEAWKAINYQLTCFFARVLCSASPWTGAAGPAGLITLLRSIVLNLDTEQRK